LLKQNLLRDNIFFLNCLRKGQFSLACPILAASGHKDRHQTDTKNRASSLPSVGSRNPFAATDLQLSIDGVSVCLISIRRRARLAAACACCSPAGCNGNYTPDNPEGRIEHRILQTLATTSSAAVDACNEASPSIRRKQGYGWLAH
jgi:hypothetical protein